MLLRSLRRSAPLLPVLALTLLVAGCGGSGSSPSKSATTSPTVTSRAATSPAVAAGNAQQFCTLVHQQQAMLQGDRVSKLVTGGTPADWRAYLAAADVADEQMTAAAPAEIKPSLQVLVTREHTMRQMLEAAGYDLSKVDTAKLIGVLQDKDALAATTALAGYVKTACGIDLSLAGA